MVAENGDLLRRVWWAKHLGYVRFLTNRYFSSLSLADCKLARPSICVIRSRAPRGGTKPQRFQASRLRNESQPQGLP
jgi:hypothetical protein